MQITCMCTWGCGIFFVSSRGRSKRAGSEGMLKILPTVSREASYHFSFGGKFTLAGLSPPTPFIILKLYRGRWLAALIHERGEGIYRMCSLQFGFRVSKRKWELIPHTLRVMKMPIVELVCAWRKDGNRRGLNVPLNMQQNWKDWDERHSRRMRGE